MEKRDSTNALIFTETFDHDDDGNMIWRERDDTGVRVSYQWDDFNKLIAVSSAISGVPSTDPDDPKQENHYGVNGFRRKKKAKSGAVTTEYATGLATAVAKGAGDPISYIQGPQILGFEKGGEFFWFLTDALGSVRDICRGSDGAVLQSYDYTENGDKTTVNGSGPQSAKTWVGGLSVNDDVGDSGLYLMGHRHYDAELGRFISRDPIGFAGGLNLFNGHSANPVTFVDPAGLCPDGGKEQRKRAKAAADAHFESTRKASGEYYAEVLVSDALAAFASQWGHSATHIGGTVFTMGQFGMHTYPKAEYIDIQNDIRNTTGYRVKMNEAQYRAALETAYMLKEFNPPVKTRLNSTYTPWNQCTTACCEIVEAGGTDLFPDSFYTPGDIASQLKARGADIFYYPQDPIPAPVSHPGYEAQGADSFLRGGW
jgi:RHS repeat-associated protein